MAVTEMYTYHKTAQIQEKNRYVSDGHGTEPLIRTNRYLQDKAYLASETRGYNLPENFLIASLMMALQKKI